jgi:hypothetical protein
MDITKSCESFYDLLQYFITVGEMALASLRHDKLVRP